VPPDWADFRAEAVTAGNGNRISARKIVCRLPSRAKAQVFPQTWTAWLKPRPFKTSLPRRRSDTEHHHLGRFDQRSDGLAFFETHLTRRVGGDDGGDDLAADGEAHLGEEAFDSELNNTADELIAAAHRAHHLTLRSFRAFRFEKQSVEFGL